MLELWLNKVKEGEVGRDHITVVKSSCRTGYKKILIKNLNPEKINKIDAIVNDLMNLDATDSKLDKDLQNCARQHVNFSKVIIFLFLKHNM